MEIEKGRIEEVWDYSHYRVLKYTQVIINKDINESKEIVAEDLNSLMFKVRKQLNEWRY